MRQITKSNIHLSTIGIKEVFSSTSLGHITFQSTEQLRKFFLGKSLLPTLISKVGKWYKSSSCLLQPLHKSYHPITKVSCDFCDLFLFNTQLCPCLMDLQLSKDLGLICQILAKPTSRVQINIWHLIMLFLAFICPTEIFIFVMFKRNFIWLSTVRIY